MSAILSQRFAPAPAIGSTNAITARAAPMLFLLPFVVTFLDSAFAYFGRPRGLVITPNAVVVPVLLAHFILFDREALRLPTRTAVWLALLAASFCMGIVTAEGIGMYRLLETGSCAASIFAGFLLWRRASDADQLARWMIGLSLFYVIVCLIGLSGALPQYFPMVTYYWSQEGIAQARPMLTADSNMQVYYLFPAALALALPFRLVRASLSVLAVVGGLYVLARLQTRSGTLVYAGILALVLIAPLYNPSLGRKKVLLYPIAGIAAVAAFWPIIHKTFELLLYRFSQPDLASGNGRLESTVYGLHHIFNPYWWVPRGADEFVRQYGALPHSNLTAVFLDGGLLGLIAWIAIVIAPLVRMSLLVMKGKADAAATMAWIAAAAVLFLQLSLHNPFRDQVWLWAGALLGALTRLESSDPLPAAMPASTIASIPASVRVDERGIINARIPR